jgi:hypothetical protein
VVVESLTASSREGVPQGASQELLFGAARLIQADSKIVAAGEQGDTRYLAVARYLGG